MQTKSGQSADKAATAGALIIGSLFIGALGVGTGIGFLVVVAGVMGVSGIVSAANALGGHMQDCMDKE